MGAHSKGMKKMDIMGSINKYVMINFLCFVYLINFLHCIAKLNKIHPNRGKTIKKKGTNMKS